MRQDLEPIEFDLGELHPRQGDALETEATELLYGGAAGGGKSHFFRIAAIAWCLQIPGLQVYLFRRTHPDLWKNHMEGPSSFLVLLAVLIQEKAVAVNMSDATISFPNGSKIFLCHCQYEKDVYKYQGSEIHVLMMDELTHFTAKQYRFLRGRVRLGGLKVPDEFKGRFPRVVCGSNPGGLGHNWVKAAWVDLAPPMAITRMPKSEGGMLRQYIPAKMTDNPTLTENDPDYADRLEGLGDPALVRAMLDGDWDIVAGGMFDDLWDRAVHVLKPFEIPSSWLIDRSFDWGSSRPFSVCWWAESDGTEATMADGTKRIWPRGTLFHIAEWYGWNEQPNEGCKMLAVDIADGILEREKTMGLEGRVLVGPADSAIFAAENGVCISDDMESRGCRWDPADKSPGSRKTGWEGIRKRLKASRQTPMELPGLFVFDNCTQWIRTVPTLPRDQHQTDDVNTKAEDHAGDATRYRVMHVRPAAFVQELNL